MSTLSRRGLVISAAALPALALPAVAILPATAAAAVESPPAMPPPPSETPIDRLWKKRAALKSKDRALGKLIQHLEQQVENALPEPDPSIIYSADNDADGLEWRFKHRAPDRFIPPYEIGRELAKLPDGSFLTHEIEVLLEKNALKLPEPTPEQAARRSRLEKRLALSEAHCKQMRELQLKLGLIKKLDEQEELTTRLCTIESRIIATKPVKCADIEKKFALYDLDSDNFYAPALVRDLRRLYEQKMMLPT